jgi:tetratricopeptide (TPR) repeat protein
MRPRVPRLTSCRRPFAAGLLAAACLVLAAGCAANDPTELYKQGLQARNLEERAQIMSQALASKPDFEAARFQRARAYIALGKHEEALQDFQELLNRRRGRGREVLYYWMGFTYEHAGRLHEAIDHYSKALDISPWFLNAYEERGEAYFKAGRYAEAARDLTERMARDQGRPHGAGRRKRGNWAYMRAFARVCTGQWESAARDFETAIANVSAPARKARAVLNLYLVACRIGSKKKADVVLRRYAEDVMKRPGTAPPWAFAAVWYVAGLIDRDQFLATSRQKSGPDQARRLSQAYYYIGAKALVNEEREAAADAFRRATREAFPASYEYHMARVELKRIATGGETADELVARALDEGDQARRLRLLARALRLEPDHVGALSNRAALHALMGEHDKAIADYTRLLRLVKRPAKIAEFLRHRAFTYAQKGNHESAAADFRAALKHAPRSRAARNGLAWSLGTLRQYDEAAKHYAAIAAQATGRGQKAPWLMSKGLALSCAGKWVEATGAFRAALKDGGTGAMLHAHLYIAERHTGSATAMQRLKAFCNTIKVADWAESVAWHVEGRTSAEQLLAASQHTEPKVQLERTSRAHYYIGAARRFTDGATRNEVRAAYATCVQLGKKLGRESWEFRLALAELGRDK